MTSDSDLLRQFADHGDAAAFAEVVRRQADLVYSVALRVTVNPALAQDVTQVVFGLLARRAGRLARYDTLVGWLHTTARHTAINAVRGEERRRAREQEALAMQTANTFPAVDWEQLRPILDEAVDSLREDDRQAVLLRYFKNLSHQEVGAALGLSEDTARKRVERALEKLRAYFGHRGITATAAILAEAIGANSVQAAPAGLLEKLTPASLVGVGGVGAGWPCSVILMNAKTKIIMGLVVIAVLVGIVTLNPRRAAEPAITATAKVAVGVNSAKVQTQVVAPLRPAAYPKDASAASVPSAISPEATSVAPRSDSDPQADLSTALPHLINLIQAGQILDAFEQYMPPSYFASMPAQIKAQLKQQEANLLADPGAAKTRERVVSVLRDMLMQMPEMDEMGDRATYRSDASQFKAAFQASQLTFVKINGQWFFAPGTEPGFF